MKITKRQLRKIIKENRKQEIIGLISDRIGDIGFGKETEEDFEAALIELGEDGLVSQEETSQLDYNEWLGLKENKMKITKRQLRRIIKEEIERSVLMVETVFRGEKGRWEVAWSPEDETWELRAEEWNGTKTVAKGPAESTGSGANFLGEKGTDIVKAVQAHRNEQEDAYKYGGVEYELPENEKEGWSIKFEFDEVEDPHDLTAAFDNVTQAMRDAWMN